MRTIGSTLFILTAAAFTSVFTDPASAKENQLGNLDDQTIDLPDDNLIGNMIWVVVSLFLVIGLILVFIKFLSQRNRLFGPNRSIRTLGGAQLGQNKSVQAVEFAGRIYVVGVGEDITLLDKIDEEAAAREIISSMEQQSGQGFIGVSMADLLLKFRNRKKNEEPKDQLWNPSSSFQELLQEKLQQQAGRKQKMEAAFKEAKQTDRLMDE
ncbi:flagellar biosynthetic protein FliO [Paenibacillus tarimensis]